MTERSTRPVGIEGARDDSPPAWQPRETPWSFGPTERHVVGLIPPPLPFEFSQSAAPNTQEDHRVSTAGAQEVETVGQLPTVVPNRDFGKRGLQPLSSWEGVVENVWSDTFRCRLVEIVEGKPNLEAIQFTEFSLSDLANESDWSLVQPGAVLYWTIGRARNPAGTVTNESLVRFRRLPSLSRARQEKARREAEDVLSALGGVNGSVSPGA